MPNLSAILIGDWQVDPKANRIRRDDFEVELEPQVMDLLILLAETPGEVVLKPDIASRLWGEIHVGEDALTRCVFKLRKALQDDARAPRYIETVSKRGYRLIAEVQQKPDAQTASIGALRHTRRYKTLLWPGIIVASMCIALGFLYASQDKPIPSDPHSGWLERADGFYSQFTRADNEAALQLYQSILDTDPENAAALAGYSNTLTQRLIRYQGPDSDGPGRRSLTEALNSGWLTTPEAKIGLEQALSLARQATKIDPSHARAWRALGLALAADMNYREAQRAYERALIINPDDWGTMINLSELYGLMGQPEASLPYLTEAWFAMERKFADEPVSIRTWHSAVGLAVAEAKFETRDLEESKLWFRRVLARDPLNIEAMRGLSKTLTELGEDTEARRICSELAALDDNAC